MSESSATCARWPGAGETDGFISDCWDSMRAGSLGLGLNRFRFREPIAAGARGVLAPFSPPGSPARVVVLR
ncbi:hypothetical protein ACP70R_024976 [Stipagrostis hirtigluma subsp. patula]